MIGCVFRDQCSVLEKWGPPWHFLIHFGQSLICCLLYVKASKVIVSKAFGRRYFRKPKCGIVYSASKMFQVQYWKEKLSHIFLFVPSLVLTRLFSWTTRRRFQQRVFLWTDNWLQLGFRGYDLSSESCKLKSCFVKLLFRLLSNTRSCIDHSTTHLRGNET